MSKELTPLKALEEIKKHDIHCSIINKKFVLDKEWNDKYELIETELKEHEELLKIDCKQNTINDFYPDTISMIKDLINLYETKVIDNLKSGELYTKDRLLEILGFASRYY